MTRPEFLLLAFLALPARSGPEWARRPLAWAKARLGSPVRPERIAARRFLAFQAARVLPFLQEALGSPHWRVREGALQVLGWGDRPLPAGAAERLARDPSWPVRRNLAWLLGWREEGKEPLRLLAGDPFRDVRAQAVSALAASGVLDGKAALAALEDPAPPIGEAALRVLAFAPLPPPLPRAPGEGEGGAALARTLRALAARPCAGQRPWLEALFRPGPAGRGLGEKLLALQVLRPLGSVRPGDAGLVLQGLRSGDPFLRSAALGAGLLLSGPQVASLLSEGLRIPGRDGFQGFLKIAEARKKSLAPLLVPHLDRLLRERKALLEGAILLEGGAPAVPDFLWRVFQKRIALETALRIRLAGGLASSAQAPGLREWLLRVLSGNPDGILRDRLLPLLLPYAGEEKTAAFLLALLPRLPWWRRKALVRALVEKAGGKPRPALLDLPERGLVRDGSPLAQYLEALRDYPPTRRYRALLRRILAESRSPRVRVQAARNLTRRPSALDDRDLAALERAALAAEAGSIGEACLEALAAAGRWAAVERILSSLPKKRALPLERFLARMARRKGWTGAKPYLRRWIRSRDDARLDLEVFLALASLGEAGAWERLLALSLSAGELAVERIQEAFLEAPEEAAKKAFAAWTRPEAPVYLQEAACSLAGERPRCGDGKVLEGLLFGKGPVQVRAAALAALTAAGSPLPGKLLSDYLEGRGGGFFRGWWEEAFREVLGVLARIRNRPDWTETFLWSALFHPFFHDPLGSLEWEQPFWGGRGRSRLEEARLLAGVLFRSSQERIRRSLKAVLARREGSLGRGLLGKRLLLSLLFELARPDRGRRSWRGLEGDLAELVLQLAPRGGLPDLYASLLLARRAARAQRWDQAALLARRACREALLGTVALREVELVLGETDPAARSFPLARLGAAPFLYQALSALAAGKKDGARRLARLALEAGGADGSIRAKAERILAEAEK